MRRQDDPVEHVTAVGRLHPVWLAAGCGQLVEDVLVLMGELLDAGAFWRVAGRHGIEVGRMHVVVLLHEQALSVVHQLQRAEVGLLGRQLCHLALEVRAVEVDRAVPYTYII